MDLHEFDRRELAEFVTQFGQFAAEFVTQLGRELAELHIHLSLLAQAGGCPHAEPVHS